MKLFLLQHSPQDRMGFEEFFQACLAAVKTGQKAVVFLRGDGVYQAIKGQRLDEPGFCMPVEGGWNALLAHGVEVLINRRCADLRGLGKGEVFFSEARLSNLQELCRLSLNSDEVHSF